MRHCIFPPPLLFKWRRSKWVKKNKRRGAANQ
jgi:hypothetical protein